VETIQKASTHESAKTHAGNVFASPRGLKSLLTPCYKL